MITEEEFSLSTLQQLDGGKIERVISGHLRRLANDCYDRAADDRERKLVIEISLVPICDGDGTAETVKTQIKATSKVPHHRSKPYEMRITNRGSGLAFNVGSPESMNQHTIDFEQEDKSDE